MTHFDDCICRGLLFVLFVYTLRGCPLDVVNDLLTLFGLIGSFIRLLLC
jgi:hypothetical protein